MRLLNRAISCFERAASIIVIVFMGAMSLVAFAAVIFRFVLQRPLAWSEELARYMMVWVTFMGAGIALSQGRQIGVTLFVESLPKPLRKAALLIAELVVLVFLLVATYQGLSFTWALRKQTSPAMGISMIMPYISIPLGCIYMTLVIVKRLASNSDKQLSVQDLELKAIREEQRHDMAYKS